MENEISLTVVTPFGTYKEAKVASVILPAVRSSVDILPDRAPSVFVLDFGVMKILAKDGSVKEQYFIYSGVADIAENRCLVMTQGAQPVNDITAHEAKRRVEDADTEQERLFYQMILDHQRGIRRRYLRTLKLYPYKKDRQS